MKWIQLKKIGRGLLQEYLCDSEVRTCTVLSVKSVARPPVLWLLLECSTQSKDRTCMLPTSTLQPRCSLHEYFHPVCFNLCAHRSEARQAASRPA